MRQTFQLSSVLYPDEDVAEGFLQFVADNADINMCTIYGRGTFHSMEMIQCVTPKPTTTNSKGIVRFTGVFGRRMIRKTGQITVQTFERDLVGLKAMKAEVAGNDNPITLRIADVLWMYGKLQEIPPICGWNGFMEKLTSKKPYAVSDVLALPFINAFK